MDGGYSHPNRGLNPLWLWSSKLSPKIKLASFCPRGLSGTFLQLRNFLIFSQFFGIFQEIFGIFFKFLFRSKICEIEASWCSFFDPVGCIVSTGNENVMERRGESNIAHENKESSVKIVGKPNAHKGYPMFVGNA